MAQYLIDSLFEDVAAKVHDKEDMTTPPRYLYKFMSNDLERIGDVLIHKRLYFTNPESFNDPFDCAIGLDLSVETSDNNWRIFFEHINKSQAETEQNGFVKNKINTIIEHKKWKDAGFLSEFRSYFYEMTKELNKNMGVLCLTSEPENILMWAHYASNHKGLLLKFDLHQGYNPSEVDYKQTFPTIQDCLASFKNPTGRDFAQLFWCRKSEDWGYEKEWRFFADTSDTEGHYFPMAIFPQLCGVIFGKNMPDKTRELIKVWANGSEPEIEFYEAVPKQGCFGMGIHPITSAF